MDISLIFVIVIMFYFCVIFPLQMRLNSRRHPTTNNQPCTRNVAQQNTNILPEERSDHRLVFGISSHNTPSGTESHEMDEATRHLEDEHRQQIIGIQREIEQEARNRNATNLPPKLINSSTVRDPVAYYSQQIIDLQRKIEREAIQRQKERTPHMPSRLNLTNRSSIYTITTGNAVGDFNSSVNYPYAPSTPDVDIERHIHYPHRPNSKVDELPSYEQAVIFGSTTSATMSRF